MKAAANDTRGTGSDERKKTNRQAGEATDDVEPTYQRVEKTATIRSASEPRWQFRTLGKEGY